MASIREQIVLQIIALLEASGAPSGLTVHRERTRPIEKDSLPAILVYADDDDPEPLAAQQYKAPLVTRDLILSLEHRALGTLDNPPDAALDPLLVWATQQILGNEKLPTTDFPDGLANGVIEGKTKWNSREGDQLFASATQTLKVKYRTSRTDPTAKS